MLQPLLHHLDVDGCGHFANKVPIFYYISSCKKNCYYTIHYETRLNYHLCECPRRPQHRTHKTGERTLYPEASSGLQHEAWESVLSV